MISGEFQVDGAGERHGRQRRAAGCSGRMAGVLRCEAGRRDEGEVFSSTILYYSLRRLSIITAPLPPHSYHSRVKP